MFGFIHKIRRHEIDRNKLPDDLKMKLDVFDKAYSMYVNADNVNTEYMALETLKIISEKLSIEIDNFLLNNKGRFSEYRSDQIISDVQYPGGQVELEEAKGTTVDKLRQRGVYKGADFYMKTTGAKITVKDYKLAPFQLNNGVFETAIVFQDESGSDAILMLHEFDELTVKEKPKKEKPLTSDELKDRIEMLTEMMLEAKHEGYPTADYEARIELLTEMLNEMK
jgi:hypothetical protein